MTIQDKLNEWVESTIEHYKNVLEEVGRPDGFVGSQSPINQLSESPEIIILGKNPGHGGSFEDSEQFRRDFLKGNQTWIKRNNRRKDGKWQYWQNIKSYLTKTFSYELLEDDSKRVLTNATFFESPTPSGLPPKAYEKTIKCTLSLIDILLPKKKVVICMGASDYFRFITGFTERNDKYACEGLFYGVRNGIKYIGMPHPSGRQSKPKREFIKEFIYAVVNSCNFEEIEEIIEESYKRYLSVDKEHDEIYRNVRNHMCENYLNNIISNDNIEMSIKLKFCDFELYLILNDKPDKQLIGLRHGPFTDKNHVTPLGDNNKKLKLFIDNNYKSNKWWTAYKHFEDYEGNTPGIIANNIITELETIVGLMNE